MTTINGGEHRPPVHLLASESDLVANLALRSEDRQPVVAAMLLEEIERAELHDAETLPPGHAQLNSRVTFVDRKTGQVREVQLVVPAEADISQGRVSIVTPIGAALYGLAAGHAIEWPDLEGRYRPIRVIAVRQPDEGVPSADHAH